MNTMGWLGGVLGAALVRWRVVAPPPHLPHDNYQDRNAAGWLVAAGGAEVAYYR